MFFGSFWRSPKAKTIAGLKDIRFVRQLGNAEANSRLAHNCDWWSFAKEIRVGVLCDLLPKTSGGQVKMARGAFKSAGQAGFADGDTLVNQGR